MSQLPPQQPFDNSPQQATPIPVAEISPVEYSDSRPPRKTGCVLAVVGALLLFCLAVVFVGIFAVAKVIEEFNRGMAVALADDSDINLVDDLGVKEFEAIREGLDPSIPSPINVDQFASWFDHFVKEDENSTLSRAMQRRLIDYRQFIRRVGKHGFRDAILDSNYYVQDMMDSQYQPHTFKGYRLLSAHKDPGLKDGYIVYAYVQQFNDIIPARYWLVKNGEAWKAYDWQEIDHGGPYSNTVAVSYAASYLFEFDDAYEAISKVNSIMEGGHRSRETLEAIENFNFHPKYRDLISKHVSYAWSRCRRPDRVVDTVNSMEHPERYPGSLLVKAMAEYQRENYQEAMEISKSYHDTIGHNPDNLTWLLNSHVQLGNWSQAVDTAEKLVTVSMDQDSVWFEVLEVIDDSSFPRLEDIVLKLPDAEEKALTAANYFLAYGSYDLARKTIDLAKREGYQSETWQQYEIQLMIDDGQRDEGVAKLKTLVESIEPSNDSDEESGADSTYTLWSTYLSALEEDCRLVEAYQSADDKDEFFKQWSETTYYEAGYQWENRELLQVRLKDSPDDLDSQILLANHFISGGDYATGVEMLDLVHKNENRDELAVDQYFYNYMNALYREDKDRQALAIKPDDRATAFDYLAYYIVTEKKPTERLKQLVDAFTDVANSATRDESIWFELCSLLTTLDSKSNKEQVEILLNFIANVDPDSTSQLAVALKRAVELGVSDQRLTALGEQLKILGTDVSVIQSVQYGESNNQLFRRLVDCFFQPRAFVRSNPYTLSEGNASWLIWHCLAAGKMKDHTRLLSADLLGDEVTLTRLREFFDATREEETSLSIYDYQQIERYYIAALKDKGILDSVFQQAESFSRQFHDADLMIQAAVAQDNCAELLEFGNRNPEFSSEVELALSYYGQHKLDEPVWGEFRKRFVPGINQYNHLDPVYLFVSSESEIGSKDDLLRLFKEQVTEAGQAREIPVESKHTPNVSHYQFQFNNQTVHLSIGSEPIAKIIDHPDDQLSERIRNCNHWLVVDLVKPPVDYEKQEEIKTEFRQQIVQPLLQQEDFIAAYFEQEGNVLLRDQALKLVSASADDDTYLGYQGIYFTYNFTRRASSRERNYNELNSELQQRPDLDNVALKIAVEIENSACFEKLWLDVERLERMTWNQFKFIAKPVDDSLLNSTITSDKPYEITSVRVVDWKFE